MFKKKIQCKCGKKVDKKFNFCPYCGADLKTEREQKKAFEEELKAVTKEVENAFGMPLFMRFPFEKLVKRMMKEIDEQFREFDEMLAKKESTDLIKEPIAASGISIHIKTTPEGEPVIQVKHFGPGGKKIIKEVSHADEKEIEKAKSLQEISAAKTAKYAKLPREEPETKVRRLTDKIVYEISLPGVKDEKDVIINKLQNSIEIKAFAKDKVYFKLIPLALTIKNYRLENEKLILELKP